ncbi:MAG: hypothetical protein DRI98_09165 [Bacteroidetes bacterium]|nr:MAG: hypothetical protein DRI98_09165 [Bacteroidota bacterium]
MPSLEERLAGITARREAGNVHSNPFAGLLDYIAGAGNPNTLFEGQGAASLPTDGNIPSPLAGHPIYGNAFQPFDESLNQTPEGIATKKAEVAARAERNSNIPSLLPDPTDSSAGALPVVETPEEPSVQEARRKQLDAASADIAQQSKVSMAQAGATKEELSAWDKFSSEYDLATIGMALMASNDGSSTFSSNFGKALMAGKQAKMSAKDKATAAATAGRKEARDERDITVKEANAYTARMKAMADGAGVKWEDSTTTSSAYVVQGFKKAGIDAGEIEDGLTIEERNKVIGAAINTRLKSNPPSSTSERDAVIDQAVADYMSQFHNTAMFFGEDWERIAGG